MRNIKLVARRIGNTDGAEIAEAALVLPLVFLLLFGIIWFGRAFNIYSTIQQAAQQGAITAARASCATCGTSFPDDQTVDNVIFAVMRASSLDPGQISSGSAIGPLLRPCGISPLSPPLSLPKTCTATNNILICRNVLLEPVGSATPSPQCGIVVSFQYPFPFSVPFASPNFVLHAQAQSRMEF